MKKTVRNILIMVAVLIVLGGAALLLILLPGQGAEEESSGVSAVSSEAAPSEVLVKKELSELTSLSVEQEKDSYVIVPDGEDFTLQGYEEFELDASQIRANVNKLISLSAAKSLGEQSDLPSFGLTGETAVSVAMKFKDGSSEELVLGNAAAESSGRYVMKDGKVYIVSGLSPSLFEGKYTYFSTEMYTIPDRATEGSDTESSSSEGTTENILYSLKLSGTNFPQDIEVKYESGSFNNYLVTAPVLAESGSTQFYTIIENLKSLTAESVVGAKLTPEMLEEFGLDEPNAIAEFDLNSQKHTLQVSTQGEDYYVLLDDRDLIYKVAKDSVTSWADVTLSQIRMSYIWLNNIQEVDRLTLTVGKTEHRFDVTRTVNEESSTEANTSYDLTIQTADGKSIEYETYQKLYQEVLGITVLFSDPAEYGDTPDFQIEYHRFDGGKDTVSFYPVGEDRYAAVLNGSYNGLVRKSSVDKVISVLNEVY